MILYLNLAVLAVIGAMTWWLTGLDKTAGGESKRSHYFTRTLRCLGVVFLFACMLGLAQLPGIGIGGMPVLIIFPVGIALLLRSSIAELFTHGFLRMIDPAHYDSRELDPKKAQRYQDAIAHLIHHGKEAEAIKLCEELKRSGEVDAITLAHTLEFLGVKQERRQTSPQLEAVRLRVQGKFTEAEKLLKSLLAKKPADGATAIMLMRLYAEDLKQSERAYDMLRALEKQSHADPNHVEFARRSLPEWCRPKPVSPEAPAPPEVATVEELLARGGVGSAIEKMEAQIAAQPRDFELQFRLAEIYAVYSHNFLKAEKMISQLERTSDGTPEQLALARAQLSAWHLDRVKRSSLA